MVAAEATGVVDGVWTAVSVAGLLLTVTLAAATGARRRGVVRAVGGVCDPVCVTPCIAKLHVP
jgi:hypothetical protein